MIRQPNIVLITSDQHWADCLGAAGHPCIRTPHLDKLAALGTCFTRAYSDCPLSIPQRTTFITGIKAHNYGMPAYNAAFRILHPREKFLGSLLIAAGYQTHLIGKRHWHTDPSFRAGFECVTPYELLADKIRTHTGRHDVNFSGLGYNEMHPSFNPLPPGLTSTDWAIDRAIDFFNHQRDRTVPFMLWVSLTDPHPPNAVNHRLISGKPPACFNTTIQKSEEY
jgi:arylsulfatase A-like enzyme